MRNVAAKSVAISAELKWALREAIPKRRLSMKRQKRKSILGLSQIWSTRQRNGQVTIRILRNVFVAVVSLYDYHVYTSNRHIVVKVANMCAL